MRWTGWMRNSAAATGRLSVEPISWTGFDPKRASRAVQKLRFLHEVGGGGAAHLNGAFVSDGYQADFLKRNGYEPHCH
jgi:hypothetical protein